MDNKKVEIFLRDLVLGKYDNDEGMKEKALDLLLNTEDVIKESYPKEIEKKIPDADINIYNPKTNKYIQLTTSEWHKINSILIREKFHDFSPLIEAVKELRTLKGLPLKDAKAIIEFDGNFQAYDIYTENHKLYLANLGLT